jgi:hypothetical protein
MGDTNKIVIPRCGGDTEKRVTYWVPASRHGEAVGVARVAGMTMKKRMRKKEAYDPNFASKAV